ncbi:hypothetical protein BAY61_15935 [Prauserella marina]|uniref:Uncharacterized conserved protein n=1 Tax=Prauserella marina TaxID=530584 RepID=A0A222VQQ8_9PSEU|nr:YciI family protein [Prauserella marina]ASR36247.1 hypothetical protein BAY61_15935 [Prauserella marina]PWV77017.1 hypothetical protein DES30_105234 [Prauserella marina]SDD02472.1 Uncharacterized conserved protein [Prauserella marina]
MKYLLLIYSNPTRWEHPMFERDAGFEALSERERAEVSGEAEVLASELVASGELVSGVALGSPARARTVRPVDGLPVVTDGPFGEAKEVLAGYFVLDCESERRAVEIASRFPDSRFGAVEVRPVDEVSVFGA